MHEFARRTAVLVMAGSLVVGLTGCGTILGGSAQEINVSSEPSEATVRFDRVNRTVTTPAEVELKRKNAYEVTFSKEGYTTERTVIESNLRAGILVLDILFTGLIGVAIDAGTGAWNALSPENVSVTLQRQSAAVTGPERIDVRLRTGETSDGAAALDLEAEEPVKVRIRRLP